MIFKALLICAVCACAYSQNYGPTTTPVPILKQVNRQNDDGSYSFGYEAADGSFKIETKYPNGDVAGKYGYVDETGKVREVSYGASSQRGFEPEGPGIMVPPPTLNNPSTNALTDGQEDDGQYREDPKIYEDPKYNGRAAKPASFRQYQQPAQAIQPEPKFQSSFPAQQQSFQSSFQSQPQTQQYQPQYQPQQYQPQYQPQPQQYQPQPQQYQPQPQQYQPQQQKYQPQPQQPLFTQSSLFNQSPQQFSQEYRPQSQVYHQQPQFSYQAYTPQPHQNYQSQNFQNQNFSPFSGHPAQNFDPNTGSYSINYTGK